MVIDLARIQFVCPFFCQFLSHSCRSKLKCLDRLASRLKLNCMRKLNKLQYSFSLKTIGVFRELTKHAFSIFSEKNIRCSIRVVNSCCLMAITGFHFLFHEDHSNPRLESQATSRVQTFGSCSLDLSHPNIGPCFSNLASRVADAVPTAGSTMRGSDITPNVLKPNGLRKFFAATSSEGKRLTFGSYRSALFMSHLGLQHLQLKG